MYTGDSKILISVIIKNMTGILSRISNTCSENGINIDKLTMSNFKTNNYAEQRAILSIECPNINIEKLFENLKELGVVVRYYMYIPNNYIQRELLLLKVKANDEAIEEILELVNEYQGRNIHYVDGDVMIFEFANEEEKNQELMFRIEQITDNAEILQSGLVAISLDDNMDN